MRIEPAASLVGGLAVPGDKSISHRAVLLGAVADGESELTGFGISEDTLATVEAARALGAEARVDGDRVTVAGLGVRGLWLGLRLGAHGAAGHGARGEHERQRGGEQPEAQRRAHAATLFTLYIVSMRRP